MQKMQKRICSFFLVFAVVVTTLFGSVPQAAFAGDVNEGAAAQADAAWADGIKDEALVAEHKAVWMDTSETVEERVQALLACMTLEEKAAQMVQAEQGGTAGNTPATPEDVKTYGLGSILSGGGSAPPTGNSAEDWKLRVNEYKAAALLSRLGIPLIYGVDGVHGHNNVDNAVIFPHNIGLGAANDAELTKKVGAAAAEEIRATGIQWTFAPTLGVPESERWGRFYECFSDDPERVANMGAAYIKGFQGENFGEANVAASAKHYIGEGQTENGANQGNVNRTQEEFDQDLKDKGLLEPYKKAIEAGAFTVMASYNSVNGVKCHANKHLLTDILKGVKGEGTPGEGVPDELRLGFEGFVVSDYNGVDQVAGADFNEKVANSVNAGVDMFMEPYAWKNLINAIVSNNKKGVITKERIDDAVSRILKVKFEMGLFEEQVNSQTQQALMEKFGGSEHRAVAREAVQKSVTVLKNGKAGSADKTALQMLKEAKKVTVAGAKANDIGAQCGGWTISWQGGLDADNKNSDGMQGSAAKVTQGTTILEGFREAAAAKSGVTVSYNARGKISEGTDVAVVVVGEDPYAESSGDKKAEELTLDATDKNTIETALATKGDAAAVLVLTTGRPIAIADYVERFDAVVEAWLPGSEGAGVADVMLGDAEYTGTLPVTWVWYPTDLDKKNDASKVLFPRGTGLKTDGSSIIEGGQTAIPSDKPQEPGDEEESEVPMYSGAIDFEKNDYKLEGEWCNSGSYNVSTGSELAGNDRVGYVEWTKQDWGNAKWLAFFRQAGTYNVTLHMKVTEPATGDFASFQFCIYQTGDPNPNMKINMPSSREGYQDYTVQGELTVPESGKWNVKIMDSDNQVNAKLDYIKFELKEAQGDKDTGEDEKDEEDPTDETPKPSNGTMVKKDAVKVYMTSTEKAQNPEWCKYPIEMANQLTEKDSLDITSKDDQELTTITINPDKTYQEFLGMGTSLEESSVSNFIQLEPELEDELIDSLVDPVNGAGMTLFRVTIGTADFTSRHFYTYYDVEGNKLDATNGIKNADGTFSPDWQNTTGKGFSIQKDIDYKVIETIKKVQAAAKKFGVEDEIKFFASSWTPPGWMKDETAFSKSHDDAYDKGMLLRGGTLKDGCIDDLAMYYTRFLEEYAKLGIDIYAMTLQNEPGGEFDYPSCLISGAQEAKLAIAIKKAVAASDVLKTTQFAKNCKLWAFDHNPSIAENYMKSLASVEGGIDALDGIAFHDYSGSMDIMQNVYDTYLNKGTNKEQTVNLTERSVWGTMGANAIVTYLRNNAISYNSWVTMLDSNRGVHQWPGTPDPTMFSRLAGSSDDYWALPEFYITGQFTRFIRPGYVRVDSTNPGFVSNDTGTSPNNITDVVFKDPKTGTMVAVVVNATDKKQNFKVVTGSTQFISAIPARNVATYIWEELPNVQEDAKKGFDASQYASATEGVKVLEDGAVTTTSTADQIDYIINMKDAGLNGITFVQQCDAENGQIEIYQNDKKIQTVKVVSGEKLMVRATFDVAQAGVQNISIRMTPGIKLYTIAQQKAVETHTLPGKIAADQFITADGFAAVGGEHTVEKIAAGTSVSYKINVPKDDTYAIAIKALAENVSGEAFTVQVDNAVVITAGKNQSGDTAVIFGGGADYQSAMKEVDLTAGEHTFTITAKVRMNIGQISIGSYMDLEAPEIIEGSEDGKKIELTVVSGKILESTVGEGEEVTEICTVENLPEGVTAESNRKSDNTMELTLAGNRTVDFDEDRSVTVKLLVKSATGNIYTVTETFTIYAVDDEEELELQEGQDLSVPENVGDTKKITLILKGGTFRQNALSDITMTGDAARFYSIDSASYVNPSAVELTLKYNKKFYRATALELKVPSSAYDEGDTELTVTALMQPVEGLPDAIELSAQEVTLSEEEAYANVGTLAGFGIKQGNSLEYFLDVKNAGTYTVTFEITDKSGGSSKIENALGVHTGTPESPLATSPARQLIKPGLWTDKARLRCAVELQAGKQTIQFVANKDGGDNYKVESIKIAPVTAKEVADDKTETVIPTGEFYDAVGEHVIREKGDVEYTVDGTQLYYLLDVKKDAEYELKVNYSIQDASGVKLQVDWMKDGVAVPLKTVAMPATGKWETFLDTEAVLMNLRKGTNVIRLTILTDGANLRSVKLKMTKEVKFVDQVIISKESDTLKVGDKLKLTATALPEDADNRSIIWVSTNTEAAVVDDDGNVTAVGVGDTEIQAFAADGSGEYGICRIHVVPKPADVKITLNRTAGTIKEGESLQLEATVTPVETVTWSTSAPGVAAVDQTGKVTGVKAGTAKITATTASGKAAVCTVTVTAAGGNPGGSTNTENNVKVTLDKTTATIYKGKTLKLTATVTPKGTNEKLTWSSSNLKTAKVDQTGKVTGIKAGTATITVTTASGKSASCRITVKEIKSTKVTLKKKATINKGKTLKLKAVMTPKNSTDTLTWKSSNKKVAKVDKNGKVTALKKGTAKITVKTTSGKKATCKITVKEIKSKEITLKKKTLTLKKGKTYTLKATMKPKNSTDTVKWKSSNKKVVSVTQKGKIKALKKGKATITVTTSSKKKATCKVTVK